MRSAPVQGLALLGPALVVYGLFAIWPMLDVVRLSFMRWDGLAPAETFVGLDNYRFIFNDDPVFWLAFSNTLIWTALTGFVLLLCLLPFFLAPLTLRLAGLCLLVGVIASSGQWLALLAYRHARATVLAPLSYAQLIWSSAFGYAVFRAVPDRWTLVGGVIIALSGTYVVHLERVRVAALRTGAA